ncbi:tubulin polyglutamylase TTLL5 isoform X2 [Pelobates cultripes]|uniref:Tubulin--tyrosine ligase-like protein 5 n=1 Tax=Pelobates cultripes TaxID=61616 RepID=A0AAD1WFC9_PELCU|nr:tubulin polyglutamylase TTLL5 isoform X2 [Pelobates cultripes]
MDRQKKQNREPTECQKMEHQEDMSCILSTKSFSQTPIVRFRPKAVTGEPCPHEVGERYQLSYKMGIGGCRLIQDILSAHGFQEAEATSTNFNVLWTGPLQKQSLVTNLSSFQRINHFPKSNALGHKDQLYKNLQKLKKKHRNHSFDFLPESYVLPGQYREFCKALLKDRGTWITKPVSSCEGRGINLIRNPPKMIGKDKILVSKYISNPLLIDGYKFDLRLYVLVTCYDPLIIYLYKEGITRFATEKYELTEKTLSNRFMHLTNYSVNKESASFFRSQNPDVEDCGSQWSFSALLRYLKKNGKDTATLTSKIEDLVIKAIISAEETITTSCRYTLPHKRNCFELYGFDVLIDENLSPWLMEVNTSPSVTCDDFLNLKIKSNLVADMLSLVGVECKNPQEKKDKLTLANAYDEEIFHWVKDKEEERRGGFVRLFPRKDTWQRYGPLLTYKVMNKALSKHLYEKKPAIYGKSSSGPRQNIEVYEAKLPPLTQSMIKYQDKTNKLVEISKALQKNAVKAVPVLVNRRPKLEKPSCHSGRDKVPELGSGRSRKKIEISFHSGRAAVPEVGSKRSGKNVETARCSGKKVVPEVGSRRPGNSAVTSLYSGKEAIPKIGSRSTGKVVGISCRKGSEVVPEIRNRKPGNIAETYHRSSREALPKVEKRRPGNILKTCHQSGRETGQELKSGRPAGSKTNVLEARLVSVSSVKEPTMIESDKTECLWQQNEALRKRSQHIKDICDGFSSYYKQAFLE